MVGEVRYYSVEEAAHVLRLTPERVLQMLEAGELEGIQAVGTESWRVPIRAGFGVAPPPPPADVPPTSAPIEPTPEPATSRTDPPDESSPEVPTGYAEEPGEPGLPPATIEETRQPTELFRGDTAANIREPTSESGWVSTQQAAKALGISARTVRWHIERGNLEAKPEGEGVERTWRVSVDSLQMFRASRQAAGSLPRSSRVPNIGADVDAESPGNAIRELADRLVEEARRAEAARVRLELSEKAESTLREELSEERRRRKEAEKELDAARRELAALEEARAEVVVEPTGEPTGASRSAAVGPEEVSTAEAAAGALRPPESRQEAPAAGVDSDAARMGPPRRSLPRWWRRWRRS